MSDPIKLEAVTPPAPVAPKSAEPVKQVETTPAAPVTPVAKAPEQIEKVDSIADAIAVKLGEKVVKPAAPPGDDAELNKQIEAETAKFSPAEKSAWAQKTYELRDYKRKLAAAEAAVTEAAALKTKLAELETARTSNPAEVEALKKQLEAADLEVAATRLERSQSYKTQIAEPLAAAEKFATDLGVKGDITAEQVLAALRDTGPERTKKLTDVLANLPEFEKISFVNTVQRIDALRAKSTELLANAKTTLEQQTLAETAAKEQAASRRKSEYEAAKPLAWTEIETALPVLKPIEGAQDWNTGLETAKKFAENQFEAFDPKSQAAIMQRAGVFPLLQGTINHQNARIAELEADLAKYRAATPGAGGSGGGAAAPVNDPNESFTDRVSRRLREAGVA